MKFSENLMRIKMGKIDIKMMKPVYLASNNGYGQAGEVWISLWLHGCKI